jgi:DNA-binding response OmpR family regulator
VAALLAVSASALAELASPATLKLISEDSVMNILLVEDEKKITDFIRAGFREQGFVVEHCGNDNDGFGKASHGSYDVIVLDIMLPGRDGLSILKGLRKASVSTELD